MIRSSIDHVTGTALLSLPPLGANALVIVISAFATARTCLSSCVS